MGGDGFWVAHLCLGFFSVVPSGREYGGEPLRSQPSVVASVRPRSLFVRRRYVRLMGEEAFPWVGDSC